MATSRASTRAVPHDASVTKLLRMAAVGAPLAAALLVWGLSLPQIDLYSLGDYGLPPDLPLGWYVAFAVCVSGALVHACAGRTRWAWAYLFGVVAVLFLTLPLLAQQPHYSWVYKHIGVVRYIGEFHRVEADIDIYHRWPGFFALNAVFGSAGGMPNPVSFAAWSEFFFTTLNLLIVANVVRVVTGSRQIPVVAGLLFLSFNWVGQTYFSPQAMTYFFHLSILWLVVTQLGRDDLGPLGRAVVRLGSLIARRPQDMTLPAGHRWMPQWAAITAVFLLHAAIVASHQLTPYLLVLEVGALTLLGLVRRRLLVVGLLVVAVAYLAPHLDFVQSHFGLFDSVDPVRNVQRSTNYNFSPQSGKIFNERASQALVILMLLGAAVSALVLARRGLGARALLLLVLALSPISVIVGQDYGGEAPLRVVLFASPWCAALVAWAFMTAAMTSRRTIMLGVTVMVTSALFIPAYFGQEELHSVPLDEVRASEFLHTFGTSPAVVVQAATGFPRRYGARYPELRGINGEDYDPSLLQLNSFRHRALGDGDVGRVVDIIEDYAPRGYVVFNNPASSPSAYVRR